MLSARPRRPVVLAATFAVGALVMLPACGDDSERPAGDPSGTTSVPSASGSTAATGAGGAAASTTSSTTSTTVVVAGTGATGPAPGDGSGKDARPPGTNPP